VASPAIYAPDTPCSALVPQDWRGGVKSASPAPLADDATDADIAKIWQSFAIDQTAKLVGANERFSAAIGIVERCESRDEKAIKRAKPKFLGVF